MAAEAPWRQLSPRHGWYPDAVLLDFGGEASIHHNHGSGVFFFTTSAPMGVDGTSLGREDDDPGGGGGNVQPRTVDEKISLLSHLLSLDDTKKSAGHHSDFR